MMSRYLIPLFLMFLSGAVYVIWVDAPYKDIATLREKAMVFEGYIADADSAQAELDKFILQYKSFPADGDHRLQVLLPKEIDSVRLIIDVNEVAVRHGVVVVSPTINKQTTDDSAPRPRVAYAFSFKTTATLKVFRDFLVDLQRSLALRDITAISFSSASASTESVDVQSPEFTVYSYNVAMTTYALH